MKYQVELVWNREFHFVSYGDVRDSLPEAVKYARALENMGDGACVKKTRVVESETGNVVWEYGKRVKTSKKGS